MFYMLFIDLHILKKLLLSCKCEVIVKKISVESCINLISLNAVVLGMV